MSVSKQSNGKWRAVFSYVVNGERKRKTKIFRTKGEANSWLAQWQADNDPLRLEASSTLFSDYFNQYLETHVLSGIKESTQANWYAVQKYIVDKYFSSLYLDQITRNIYQRFLNDYSKTHARNTVKKRNQIVKMVIGQAFHDGLIKTDPTYNVRISGSDGKSSDEKFLEADEYQRLIDYIRSSEKLITWHTSFFVYLIALSGLRAGEALALTTDDIDVESQTLSVTKTKQRSGENATPKTKNSIRDIKLPKAFFDDYQKYILNHNFNDKKELFDGRKFATINNKWLHRIEEELNFKNLVSIHGLRHSHASYLIANGIDINYISKRLGHADTTITLRVYAHLLQVKQVSEESKTLDILSKI
ncbi:putative phage integrase [Weissella oryzae SG25]|uniref:Putative phage integrase n=1 Tax=Weissella oryzae (strain DSM 25784 / JCM 18191 / LMG 30913 / SG25) TaxID=1329250 RepID=A0A069CRK5_WEIOS|nr:site-specific integrase [Weissella oryzae]GAK30390.1 putative phage integrase [Weissella oryzae SG25]